MLGYKFSHTDYAGRGVIEAIGVGIDFKRWRFSTTRKLFYIKMKMEVIIDRRAGRHIEKEDADGVAKEIEEKIKFSYPDTSVVVAPTIGHRVTVRIRVKSHENYLQKLPTQTQHIAILEAWE